ncbi:hypothetical protein [Paraburkholderia phenoliruptrix]|uniref:hypothetical protein n=1 Tax=Paraburkholderia phenoliruptrix TaxID=252970 RepID=UPI0034CD79AE
MIHRREASRRGKLNRACLLALISWAFPAHFVLISCAQSSPKWPLPHNLKLPEITMTTHLKQLLGSALLLGGLVAL